MFIFSPHTHRRKFRLEIYSMNCFFSLSCFGDLSRNEFFPFSFQCCNAIYNIVQWYYFFPVTTDNAQLFIHFHPSNEISSLWAFDTPPSRLKTTLNIHFFSRDIFQYYYFILNQVTQQSKSLIEFHLLITELHYFLASLDHQIIKRNHFLMSHNYWRSVLHRIRKHRKR